MKQILEVKNLSVFTAAKALLHDVSFSLNEGENLVVLGRMVPANLPSRKPSWEALRSAPKVILFSAKITFLLFRQISARCSACFYLFKIHLLLRD